MAKLKIFGKKQKPLKWKEASGESEAAKLARRVRERLNGGKALSGGKRKTISRRKDESPPFQLAELEEQFAQPVRGKRSSKYWDFWKDGINNSGLALWLQCRYQFWLDYVCGYKPTTYSDPIEFGNVFHWLIEHWLRGELKNPLKQLRKDYHPKWIEGFNELTPTNKQTQEGFYALASAMFPTYAEHYKADLKKKIRGVEVQFNAKHKLEDGTKVPLYGTIDFAWENKAGLCLTDHKTSSFINEMEIGQSMPLNFQLMFYAHAWELSHPGQYAAQIEHDVIRRTTSKPHKNETLDRYAVRMGREVERNPTHYFKRFPAAVGSAKLEAFRQYVIGPMLEDFAEWVRGGRTYPNLNNLRTGYGPCKLFRPITEGAFAGLPRRRATTRGVEL